MGKPWASPPVMGECHGTTMTMMGEECHEHITTHDEECHEHHHGCEECHEHHHAMMRNAMSITTMRMPWIITRWPRSDHHHHHADEVFTSWGMETIVPVTHDQLEDILKRLAPPGVWRCVRGQRNAAHRESQGMAVFDLVPEQYEIREGRPDYTGKVCVIGASLEEEAAKQRIWKRLIG